MDRIKIGQIGVGHAHAAGKMAVYRASPDYEVVGVVEPNPALRTAAQRSPIYADLRWMTQEELLNYSGLQAVAVETQVRDLLPVAEACIAAGKHIHLDKPAGDNLSHFKRILDQAARGHLLVQLGYMYRYNPAVVQARQFLQRGWLGEPFELHGVMSKVVDPASRAALAEFKGGIMFELGCHIVDLAVSILGAPAEIHPYIRRSRSHLDALADNVLAVFSYPRALATIKSSALEVEGFARRHLTVCGTEGTLHIQPLDAPKLHVAFSQPRESYSQGYQEIVFGDYPRYVGDAAEMAQIIRGEKDPDFSYDHEYAVQAAVLRASGMSVS